MLSGVDPPQGNSHFNPHDKPQRKSISKDTILSSIGKFNFRRVPKEVPGRVVKRVAKLLGDCTPPVVLFTRRVELRLRCPSLPRGRLRQKKRDDRDEGDEDAEQLLQHPKEEITTPCPEGELIILRDRNKGSVH